jgi:3-oxoacyl-[acyl-carrier-protein] synthase-3
MMSRMVDWTDRTSCILFGDGTAAFVVTAGESLKYIRTIADPNVGMLFSKSSPHGNNPFVEPHEDENMFLQMQGQHVYKFAVRTIESEISLALAAVNKTAQDVDYFILHQANARIIEGARTRLKLPPEKFPMNIQKYGNMSAASIPVLLCEMVEDGRVKRGDLCVMIGFGAGMTAGTAVIEY